MGGVSVMSVVTSVYSAVRGLQPSINAGTWLKCRVMDRRRRTGQKKVKIAAKHERMRRQ